MAGEDREKGDFEKGLERLVRRRAVERLGRRGQTGPELRRKAREVETGLDVSGSGKRLVEEEFVVDEKRAAVAADLSTELCERFELKGLAVVLMGSSVHGGALTRRMVGAKKSGDFDYGIVLDREGIDIKKFWRIRYEMREYVKNRLTQLSENMKSCQFLNAVLK